MDEKLSAKRRSPRSSLELSRTSKPNVKGSSSTEQSTSISMTIESPPLVSYGPPKESTGALLSGLIRLHIQEAEQTFESFTLTLTSELTSKKPIGPSCHECTTTIQELNRWKLIFEPVVLTKGIHAWPFSFLFPGHLPATCDTALAKISYSLNAFASPANGDEIKFQRSINLFRSILPGPDRHSIRVFPPTNLSATVTLPSVAHLGGMFPVEIRLDGVVVNNGTHRSRWRLRKASWRIDETTRNVSTPCKNHLKKIGNGKGDDKGVLHEDVRTVGSGEVRTGWKNDFDKADGEIELQMEAGIPANSDASCDVQTGFGLSVGHVLIVEMIVAEEYFPRKNKNCNRQPPATPTGAARVLRMQFQLCVTTRSGLGISWDEEAPPMYDDVPAPPPQYVTSTGDISTFNLPQAPEYSEL